MEYTRSELIRRLSDIPRKGWADHQIRDLIDSLWRDPFFNRTSGFDTPGNFDSDIAFDNETRTFSITPKAYSFNFWQFIRKIAFFKRTEPMEVIIPDEEGFYLIYIARDEEDPKKPQKLFTLKNPTHEQEQDVYLLKTIVSWIYWDAENSQAIYFGEERHGSEWPPQVHWFIHSAIGMKTISGFEIDNFATGDTKFNITGGTALHEDILHEFDGISDGTIPILLFVDNNPRITINPGYSVLGPYWNFPINGIGGAEPADEGNHILYHIFATNCKLAPFVAQMGLNKYDDLQDAVYNANYEVKQLESMRLHKSRVLLYTVIYKVTGDAQNGMVLVRATPQHAAINWISNNYSEISAYITVQNALPYLKTGWPPNPLNYMTIVGLGGEVIIKPNAGYIPMYIQGVKINLRGDQRFPIDINIHGMQYQVNSIASMNIRTKERWDNGQNTDVFCFAQFYNKTKGKFLYHGLELHNWAMEPTSRGFMHETLFTEYVEGLAISIANNGIVVEAGKIKDEDFVLFIGQKSPLQCPKYFLYVDGTEGLTWDSYDNLAVPVILDNSNHLQYHDIENVGEMLSTETGEWTCMWVLATMCGQYPIKLIPGTGKGTTKEEAEEKNPVTELRQLIDATDFFCEEYIVLGRVPVQDTGETPFFTLTGVTDFKDIDLEKLGKDIYVEDGEFDEVSSELVLHRTQKMPEIRIPIPQPEIPEIPEQVNSDWNATEGKAKILNKPSLFSGRYSDLSGKPTIPDEQVNSDWNATEGKAKILNKPSLFSGQYSDLSGKPTIPDEQVNSDWNATEGKAKILNKPSLFSGQYSDLSGKPTIPDEQVNSDWNATEGKAKILNKPSLFSGQYSDLSGKPSIPAEQVNSDWNATEGKAKILNKPESFAPSAHEHTHNSTTEKQGGKAPDEYYHLDKDRYDKLKAFSDEIVKPNTDPGFLFDFAAITNPLFCPDGWYVCSMSRFNTFLKALGGVDSDLLGVTLTPTAPLRDPNSWIEGGGTGSSGFNLASAEAILGSNDGNHLYFPSGALAWYHSSYQHDSIMLLYGIAVGDIQGTQLEDKFVKMTSNCFFEVHPKDGKPVLLWKPANGQPNPGTMTGNDGRIYKTVKYGDYFFLAENYAETKYNDGSPIPVATNMEEWGAMPTGLRYASARTTVKTTPPNWNESDFNKPGYIANKPILKPVATSGSFNDLTDKPTIPAAQIQTDWSQKDTKAKDFLKNKPTLFSGAYVDLYNKPIIPPAQIQSDWNQENTNSKDFIKNKPAALLPTQHTHKHNDMTDFQGGKTGEYYHFTNDEYSALLLLLTSPNKLIEGVVPKIVNGLIYNKYVAGDIRNIAPPGWRAATLNDFNTLILEVGGYLHTNGFCYLDDAASIKTEGSSFWEVPFNTGTNTTGFSAKGSGYRESIGEFAELNRLYAIYGVDGVFFIELTSAIAFPSDLDNYGVSIRLIKEDSSDTGSMICNSGLEYPTVKIGNQVWMAENLCSVHFRDGSVIPEAKTIAAWVAATTSALCSYNNETKKAVDGAKVKNALANDEYKWTKDAKSMVDMSLVFENKLA